MSEKQQISVDKLSYTPQISEVRVGAIIRDDLEGFRPLNTAGVIQIMSEYQANADTLKKYKIKHLDKFDIADAGFRYSHTFVSIDNVGFNVHTNDTGIEILHDYESGYLEVYFVGTLKYPSAQIEQTPENGRHILYRGQCKNKLNFEELIENTLLNIAKNA